MISGVCPLLVEADIAARRQSKSLMTAPSAKQVICEDPSGNVIELTQPS